MHAAGRDYLSKGYDVLGYFMLVMSNLVRDNSKKKQSSLSSGKYVKLACSYIEDHMTYDISIKDVADYVKIDRSHLYRLFIKYLGISPSKYLADIRMKRALDLMEYDMLSINEIALSAGFYDSAHFSRVFFAKFGMSPGKYKKLKEGLIMSNKVPYQKSPTVMKTKRTSRKWVGILVIEIIALIVASIVLAVLAMIPVFGWIISIIGFFAEIGIVFGAIKHLFRTALAHAVLTETGIKGRDNNGKGFKLSFENIDSIQRSDDAMTIRSNIKKALGGYREYIIQDISNLDAFVTEYEKVSGKKATVTIEAKAENATEESK